MPVLRDLVEGWSIPTFILTPVIAKLHVNLSQTIHTNNSTCKRPKISEKMHSGTPHHHTSKALVFQMSEAKIECFNFKHFFELDEQFLNI